MMKARAHWITLPWWVLLVVDMEVALNGFVYTLGAMLCPFSPKLSQR